MGADYFDAEEKNERETLRGTEDGSIQYRSLDRRMG
jgi:hypothetical protein